MIDVKDPQVKKEFNLTIEQLKNIQKKAHKTHLEVSGQAATGFVLVMIQTLEILVANIVWLCLIFSNIVPGIVYYLILFTLFTALLEFKDKFKEQLRAYTETKDHAKEHEMEIEVMIDALEITRDKDAEPEDAVISKERFIN